MNKDANDDQSINEMNTDCGIDISSLNRKLTEKEAEIDALKDQYFDLKEKYENTAAELDLYKNRLALLNERYNNVCNSIRYKIGYEFTRLRSMKGILAFPARIGKLLIKGLKSRKKNPSQFSYHYKNANTHKNAHRTFGKLNKKYLQSGIYATKLNLVNSKNKVKPYSEALIDSYEELERLETAYPLDQNALPLVSVIMPSYNRANIISEAIKSVVEQEYPNWELFVCDDGSSDNTRQVVEGFQDDRIRFLSLEHAGAAAARNRGIEASHGEYIAYLDTDNIWSPKHLSLLVRMLENKSGYYCAYTKYVDVKVHSDYKLHKFDHKPFNYDDLSEKNFVDLNTFMHRRILYNNFGGFNEQLVRQQDWDLILKYTFLRNPVQIDCLPCYISEIPNGTRLPICRRATRPPSP